MNNYYKPEIEDIRVGYECQLKVTSRSFANITIGKEYYFSSKEDLEKELFMERIRTSYLTKEQIEAEGWTFDKSYLGDMYYIIKGHEIRHSLSDKIMAITRTTSNTQFFYGYCKSINEFRYITRKLLLI